MTRRALTMLLAGMLAAVMIAPAAAAPPDRFEEPFTILFPDFENELVVFVNTDRAAYCTPEVVQWENDLIAWLEGGQVGEPPPEPVFPDGFDGISVQAKQTGQGAIVALVKGSDLNLELWNIDSEENRPLVGPCTDTDDDGSFFAAGTVSFQSNDNDLFGSGTRGNSFGDQGKGDVTDADGNEYSYSWKFHINDRCYEPDDGPPACLIDTATLK